MKDPNYHTEEVQKFVIKLGGEIVVDWVIPAFSDVILELYPEQEKQKMIEMNKDSPLGPRIFCG
jgi:hypothetical protein